MPLKLLSASAGSGKTYRLSREYVRLCLEQANPAYSSSILAMTFTNKATQEMKKRILELLLNLAQRKETISQGDVLFSLFDSLGADVLARRAEAVLQYLLKHYHFFSVSTIDKFFQGIIRQFQRELSLDFPMEVDLDTDAVLNASIERLFERLDSQPELMKWFKNWMRHKVADGGDWDVRKDLRTLGKEIFQEGVSDQWDDSVSLEDMSRIERALRTYCREIDEKFEENQKAVLAILDKAELNPADFSGKDKSFIGLWLRKSLGELASSKTFKKAGDPNFWFSKGYNNQIKSKKQLIEPELLQLVNQVYTWLENDFLTYKAYKAVLKHFNTYVALRFLYDALKQYCIDNDKLLLSESNKMVAKVVEQNDLSLLYEKSGQRYRNLLVDEFQDTSGSQWTNLRPIFEQTLSEGNYDLIVGDIKQAIYRFRSGNWEIMHHRVKEELGVADELMVESLDYNFRSSPVIVDFNNQFFERAVSWLISKYKDEYKPEAAALLMELDSIYRDVFQHSAAKNAEVSGLVRVSILHPDAVEVSEVEDIEEENTLGGNEKALYDWFSSRVRDALQRGFLPNEIGVLVRTAKESAKILQWLERLRKVDPNVQHLQAASEKGLRLAGNVVVELLVQLLAFRTMPQNKAHLPQIQYFFRILKHGDIKDCTFQQDGLPEPLDKALVHPMATLSQWFVQVLDMLDLRDKSPLYVARFLDYVREFELKFGAEPTAFLQDWGANKQKLGVVVEESTYAIQVMTLHKSKGLQFPVVIIPFTNDEVHKFKSDSLIYVQHSADPNLKQLGVFPVSFAKTELNGTCFELDIQREKVMKIIDALNLIYVAYTRAEQQLEIALLPPPKQAETLRFADIIRHSLDISDISESKELVFGDPMMRKHQKKVKDSDFMPLMIDHLTFRSTPVKAGTWSDKELPTSDTVDKIAGGRQMGTLVHEVLARISTKDDLELVLTQLEGEGILKSGSQLDELRHKLSQFLALPEVAVWFGSNRKVYAEREIIEVDGKSYRPDRVVFHDTGAEVIDFKTGKPSPHYARQITRYAQLLQKMGIGPISASIAYIDSLSIQNIKIENTL